jgi:hypothetical protein
MVQTTTLDDLRDEIGLLSREDRLCLLISEVLRGDTLEGAMRVADLIETLAAFLCVEQRHILAAYVRLVAERCVMVVDRESVAADEEVARIAL